MLIIISVHIGVQNVDIVECLTIVKQLQLIMSEQFRDLLMENALCVVCVWIILYLNNSKGGKKQLL